MNLSEIYNKSKQYFDYKLGAIGASGMAILVAGINSSEGLWGATTAAMKQGAYTLTLGGFVAKACERLALSFDKKITAYSAAILLPSIFTISLTYGVHNLKGTPKPLESTIPTAIIAPIGCACLARIKRKNIERLLEQ